MSQDVEGAGGYWDAIEEAAAAKAAPAGRGPRGGGRRGGGSTPRRKALQLCRQVADTLNYVLSGECDDDVLRNLYVVRVDPAPDVGQMMVTLAPLDPHDAAPPEKALARLSHATPKLRREVAASIHRRKTPQLLFRVVAPPSDAPVAAGGGPAPAASDDSVKPDGPADEPMTDETDGDDTA